jgi:hypothetical protein
VAKEPLFSGTPLPKKSKFFLLREADQREKRGEMGEYR